jgi:hypothetical protein
MRMAASGRSHPKRKRNRWSRERGRALRPLRPEREDPLFEESLLLLTVEV